MPTPLRRPLAATALLLASALFLTSCGTRSTTGPAAIAPPSFTAAPSLLGASPDTAAPSPLGASPYVEPGAGDGAPHNGDNLAYRRPGEISTANAADARREADRIEPVLGQLWQQQKWTPEAVKAALTGLGYQEERTGSKGERLGGNLTVQAMSARYETDRYVTPPGARIGLRVHEDTCVSAFVQPSNYAVSVNGLYPETGCFEPPYGH
ncbi:hypothetical protein ABT095_13890 [Kitasatospora sp. NPDC002227]|uniref:hypothetical protein n=1 Tax=Kitasatospora sp. NPDC002227 TaxID=3154773 RepID=UPI0033196C29